MHIKNHVINVTKKIPPLYRALRNVKRILQRNNSIVYTNSAPKTRIEDLIEGDFYFSHKGYCVCCESEVIFTANDSWLRDSYLCTACHCKPRERALMNVVDECYPDWRNLKIHEGSPMDRGASIKIRNNALFYTPTQYHPDEKFGTMVNGFRNEDLEHQTFKNSSFDLVITLDVMEHVYDPAKVFQEVARTLKKGGAYIFTVPIINKHSATQVWAKRGRNGKPKFLHTPEYHGNPVDSNGSPVTMHWGFDIVDFIEKSSGLKTQIIAQYDKEKGIMGEYNEVIVARKK